MKGQVWMNGWRNICVAVLYRNWELFRHIFIASFKVLYRWTHSSPAPRSRVLFHCEVACLTLAVWPLYLAQLLSLRFLAPLFQSLCSTLLELCRLSRFFANQVLFSIFRLHLNLANTTFQVKRVNLHLQNDVRWIIYNVWKIHCSTR